MKTWAHFTCAGTSSNVYVGRRKERTGEEQLPFDEKMMKELNKKDNNITANSGSVGLHA